MYLECMSLQSINEPAAPSRLALWQLGFRPFFLAAGLFGVISVAVWMALYLFGRTPPVTAGALGWHAHEMIYGYAMAVVAGFLLTAVRNWTGRPTVTGWPLMLLALAWLAARILAFGGPLWLMAAADLLFQAGVLVAIVRPVVAVRQWTQAGILSKVLLLLVFNAVFYLGAGGWLADGVRWGIYSGLYLLIALILVMGRRVIPFFIERGIGGNVTVRNDSRVDIAGIALFVIYWLMDLLYPKGWPMALVAAALFALHLLRLVWWHKSGIWSRPLLWVLWLAYAWIVAGFGLRAVAAVAGINPLLALHALSYGGLGMMTLGMMARVSLGHTGRNIHEGSRWLGPMFGLLFAGAVARVLLPIVMPEHYRLLIGVSQGLWMAAFALFVILYAPMLLRPRIDGQPG